MVPFNNIKSQLGTRGFEQKAETISDKVPVEKVKQVLKANHR